MIPDDPSERLAGLLARAGMGDRAAFEALYVATRSKLFAVALRIVRERAAAEEVLQDSYVSIWIHARQYARAKSAPTTWMTAIVRNRCLDLLRRGTHEVEDIDDKAAATLVDESAAPGADAERTAQRHAIARCLEELEADQRQSIALAFFHGLTHSELAAHLRRPLGTVKTHVRRGLARLKECLEKSHAGKAHG
jgi:RNA polymerase sigma-70 factor (ECF subfamily)